MQKTNVYVDGFNLYKGALAGKPYRWLDLEKLATALAPNADIQRIRYFTAIMKGTPTDPDKPARQLIYIRALKTLSKVSIHFGHFRRDLPWMPMVKPPGGAPINVQVWKTEEKGSDVNLASLLLVDCFRNEFERAVVISNDSDLATPIRLVREKFGCHVTVFTPTRDPSRTLRDASNRIDTIQPGHYIASMFPQTLTDEIGTFHIPAAWMQASSPA